MSWQDIMKKNPMRSRPHSEKKKMRQNKLTKEKLERTLKEKEQELSNLKSRRDEPNRRKRVGIVRSHTRPIVGMGSENRPERRKTSEEVDKEVIAQEKKYAEFQRKLNDKIIPLNEEIKEIKDSLKKLEGEL
jgi:hypothetical protein